MTKSQRRRYIFRKRMAQVTKRKVKDTARSLDLQVEPLIPPATMRKLAIYFDEVCDLNSEQLVAECNRYEL